MALTLEAGQNVWRKVDAYLSAHDEGTASPVAVESFRALRSWLVEQNGNPNLQIVPFSAADIVTATGYHPLDVPAKVYALYVKNTGGSGGTDSYITLHNAADNASVPFITVLIQDDNDEAVFTSARGVDFTTDVAISGATTHGGATETVLAADSADGFLIIGAA